MSIDVTASLLGEHLPVPREMESTPRWLRWRLAPTKSGKSRKIPVSPSGRAVSVTDPESWGDYFDTLWTRRGDGLGFVLGEGIGGLDLDDSIDSSGRVAGWAQEVLDANPNTFKEVSQSGRGLHVWGHMDEAPGRVIRDGVRKIEVYSVGRFLALGSAFPGSPLRLAPLVVPDGIL